MTEKAKNPNELAAVIAEHNLAFGLRCVEQMEAASQALAGGDLEVAGKLLQEMKEWLSSMNEQNARAWSIALLQEVGQRVAE